MLGVSSGEEKKTPGKRKKNKTLKRTVHQLQGTEVLPVPLGQRDLDVCGRARGLVHDCCPGGQSTERSRLARIHLPDKDDVGAWQGRGVLLGESLAQWPRRGRGGGAARGGERQSGRIPGPREGREAPPLLPVSRGLSFSDLALVAALAAAATAASATAAAAAARPRPRRWALSFSLDDDSIGLSRSCSVRWVAPYPAGDAEADARCFCLELVF